jgi:predicted nucleic acid-binding protein
MAKVRLLIDTDVLIDFLKGIKTAKDLFRSERFDLYCSVQSKKELITKVGLKNSEKKAITALLSGIKVLKVDGDVINKFSLLLAKYGDAPESVADYIIAATAWAKKLPLLTRNKRHFEHIKEIVLCPHYIYEDLVTNPTKNEDKK